MMLFNTRKLRRQDTINRSLEGVSHYGMHISSTRFSTETKKLKTAFNCAGISLAKILFSVLLCNGKFEIYQKRLI